MGVLTGRWYQRVGVVITSAVAAIGPIGCVQVADDRPSVTVVQQPTKYVNDFVLLNASGYQGRFTAALAKYGFRVRPIAVRSITTEQESDSLVRQFKEAGGEYAMRLSIRKERMVCAFSDNRFVTVVVEVFSVKTNDMFLVIEQRGPDGDCPPTLTPVWDLLAAELRRQIPNA